MAGMRGGVKGLSFLKAALLLAAINTLLLALAGRPYAVSSTLAAWGAWPLKWLGGNPDQWLFFQHYAITPRFPDLLHYSGTWMVAGTLLGAALAAARHGQLYWRGPRRLSRAVSMLAGGVMMGVGARLAGGCNVGALWDGIASSSLHGWVFGLFMVLGVVTGMAVLKRII